MVQIQERFSCLIAGRTVCCVILLLVLLSSSSLESSYADLYASVSENEVQCSQGSSFTIEVTVEARVPARLPRLYYKNLILDVKRPLPKGVKLIDSETIAYLGPKETAQQTLDFSVSDEASVGTYEIEIRGRWEESLGPDEDWHGNEGRLVRFKLVVKEKTVLESAYTTTLENLFPLMLGVAGFSVLVVLVWRYKIKRSERTRVAMTLADRSNGI